MLPEQVCLSDRPTQNFPSTHGPSHLGPPQSTWCVSQLPQPMTPLFRASSARPRSPLPNAHRTPCHKKESRGRPRERRFPQLNATLFNGTFRIYEILHTCWEYIKQNFLKRFFRVCTRNYDFNTVWYSIIWSSHHVLFYSIINLYLGVFALLAKSNNVVMNIFYKIPRFIALCFIALHRCWVL